VETVPMSLQKVAEPLSLKLSISKTKQLNNVELSQTMVEASVKVTKFTEASLELPVEVQHLPRGYNLKIFPDKVLVTYNVAFDDYGKIDALLFKAIVDYSKIEQGSNKLRVELVKVPAQVRAVKLATEKVEYIIRK
jgi:hypothetical protein